MARTDHPSAELLARLHPTLERVFAAYGLTARQGDEVVGEAFMTLVSKWPRLDDPERWLLRRILDRCHALAAEATDEDAPE